jgi:hypothetical protein
VSEALSVNFSFYYFSFIESIIAEIYPRMLHSADPFSAEESPAAAAKKESKRIKAAIVILSIHCYLIVKKHAYKIEWRYKSMPQSTEETIGIARQTLINRFIVGTA